MAVFVPQMEVSLLPASQYHDRLKMLCRNTPSKPWIRDYDDPVQLIWASSSELRSQHSQMLYNQKEQAAQNTHRGSANMSSSSSSSVVNSSRTATSIKENAQGRTGKKSKKRSHSEEHEVYVISPADDGKSNVFVNNKPVTLTAAENVQVELSPKLLPSAITGEHAQLANDGKIICEKAQTSRDKLSPKPSIHSTRERKKAKKESIDSNNDTQPSYTKQKAVKKVGNTMESSNNTQFDLFGKPVHNTHSAETNSQESWESVHELHSPEQSKEQLERENKTLAETSNKMLMENGIEFTPSSAEVREGSVEILSSPPPVITIRQRRTKSSEKKASIDDAKVKTRQRRSSKSKVIDNDKVQLPMERFLRRV